MSRRSTQTLNLVCSGQTHARALALVAGGLILFISGAAEAHFNLVAPPPADTDLTGGKGAPPCGPLAPASNVVTPVQGGHPLTVSVNETVSHTGFYRIALSINSRSELPVDNVVHNATGGILPPSGSPAGLSGMADVHNPPVFPVLADDLWHHTAMGAMTFTADIMIPNVTCAKCTLQVIEYMEGHTFNFDATYPPGGGYFYHHCADLRITADPSLPLFTPGQDGGAADGATDVAARDATVDSSARDGGGTGGSNTGGSGGTGGSGTAGSGGNAGTGGVAGMVGTGTGGSGAGGAGATGGTGGTKSNGGGGCSVVSADGNVGRGLVGMVALAMVLALRRKRRSRT